MGADHPPVHAAHEATAADSGVDTVAYRRLIRHAGWHDIRSIVRCLLTPLRDVADQVFAAVGAARPRIAPHRAGARGTDVNDILGPAQVDPLIAPGEATAIRAAGCLLPQPLRG